MTLADIGLLTLAFIIIRGLWLLFRKDDKMIEALTIKQIKDNIKELEDDLELYLTLKKINFEKTQPKAINYKDVVSNKSNTHFDKFSHYMIKDEQYDETIYSKMESLNAWEKRLIDKIKNLANQNDVGFITYLREEENYSWDKIEAITHYSKRQAQRIYKKN